MRTPYSPTSSGESRTTKFLAISRMMNDGQRWTAMPTASVVLLPVNVAEVLPQNDPYSSRNKLGCVIAYCMTSHTCCHHIQCTHGVFASFAFDFSGTLDETGTRVIVSSSFESELMSSESLMIQLIQFQSLNAEEFAT